VRRTSFHASPTDEEPSSYAIRNAGVEVIVKTLDLAAQPVWLLEEAEQLRLEIESRSDATTSPLAAGR
jgi:hypothetical protein